MASHSPNLSGPPRPDAQPHAQPGCAAPDGAAEPWSIPGVGTASPRPLGTGGHGQRQRGAHRGRAPGTAPGKPRQEPGNRGRSRAAVLGSPGRHRGAAGGLPRASGAELSLRRRCRLAPPEPPLSPAATLSAPSGSRPPASVSRSPSSGVPPAQTLPCPARREASGRSFPHSPAGPAAHPPPAADGWLRGRGAGAGAAPFPAAAPRPPLLSLQKFLHLTEPPPRTDARPRRRAEGRRAASPPGRLCPREHEALRAERRGRGCECVRLSDCV